MVDRDRVPAAKTGYLWIAGQGNRPVHNINRMLHTFDASYQAIAGAELAAYEVLAAVDWLELRPSRTPYRIPNFGLPALSENSMPAPTLFLHRVSLRSPGFWEFFGALNPLEVLRTYLNDRHERRKDRVYREHAEREKLEIENALGRLEIFHRIGQIEREFGPDFLNTSVLARHFAAELRPKFEKLGEMDDLGLISGESALTGPEQHHAPDLD